MKIEAEKHNNPEEFAKFGKLRRQISKKEKDLSKLKEESEKSKLAPQVPEKENTKENEESELLVEEAKNMEDSPPLVPDQPNAVFNN